MIRTFAMSLALSLFLVSPSAATEFRTGENISVEPGEIIDDDLFIAGTSVLVAGKVTGDVLAAGQNVRVTGPVGGSVMAAGMDVRVTSDVNGSVRAIGQSVTVGGNVARNASAAGQNIFLAETARIARDFHAAGGVFEIDGIVGRDAALFGKQANVRGQIENKLYFEGNSLDLARSARVGGDLVYRSAEDVSIASGAQVHGQTQKLAPRVRPMPTPQPETPRGPFVRRFLIGLVLLSFPALYVFGAVGLALTPRLFMGAAGAVGRRTWWSLLLGTLILILGPPLLAVAASTIVGIPIALLTFVGWLFALLFSDVPVAIFLGGAVASPFTSARPISPYLSLFLGLIVLTVLAVIPIVGFITVSLTALLGLGAYARAWKGVFAELR